MPGSPTMRAKRGRATLGCLVEQLLQGGELLLAPDEARKRSVRSSEPVRASGAVAIQARRGSLLPLSVTGWQAS